MPPGSVNVPSGGTTVRRAPSRSIAWIAPKPGGTMMPLLSISSTYRVPVSSNARSMMLVKPPAWILTAPVRGSIR
jgi:hypothetical protein